MPTSVALGAHFEQFIKDQLASGRYNNASEVVRDGLRMLEDREAEKTRRLEALRAEIQKGMEGDGIPIDEAFAQVRKRLNAKIRKTG